MARQVRSEVTRAKILDAAIEVFSEVGYAAAGWGVIIERTGMTKGALYHHFDSKDALATAIIAEGSDRLQVALRRMSESSSPALENIIHGTFVITEMLSLDKLVRAAEQLAVALSGFNEAAGGFYASCMAALTAAARRASAEGDLRTDLDPVLASESIAAAMFGTRLLVASTASETAVVDDFLGRLTQLWELLLPGVVADAALPYFRQFLAREALRRASE